MVIRLILFLTKAAYAFQDTATDRFYRERDLKSLIELFVDLIEINL